MWFPYNQNNSGGHYVGPEATLVEADTVEQSWDRMREWVATNSTMRYCSCCGARWHEPWGGGYDTLAEAAEWIHDTIVVIVSADGSRKVRRTADIIAEQEDRA